MSSRAFVGPALRVQVCVCVASVFVVPACRRPAPTPPLVQPSNQNDGEPEGEVAPVVEPPPARVTIGIEVDDPNRWLYVEKVRGDAAGAWATGSFKAERNKLEIETRDVAQFAIDVSRIPIRWERLVVISIDGSNSELIQRNYSVYRFARDNHGQWIVIEP